MSDEKKYHISLDLIKRICEDASELDSITTMDGLCNFLYRKTTPGLWVRDLIKASGKDGFVNDFLMRTKDKAGRIAWIRKHLLVDEFLETGARARAEEADTAIASPEDLTEDLTLDKFERFYEGVSERCLVDDSEKLDISKGVIVEQLPVTYQDNFFLQYSPGYLEAVVAVARKPEREIVAIGSLQRDNDRYHIILPHESIAYDRLAGHQKYDLLLFEEGAADFVKKELVSGGTFTGTLHTIECTIQYRPLAVSQHTLCIDFGTSNTAAGSYGFKDPDRNEIELVSFTDVTTPNMERSYLIPTMVYVDDCSDPASIRYLFGYEAKKRMTGKGYDTDASVFYEIKRWVSTMNEEEEICDESGHTAKVTRRDIIKAYLLHVIGLSQQYFKTKFRTLHLSAPVKLKTKFYHEAVKLLGGEGYEVLPPENSIDEGIAIVYNRISDLIRIKRSERDKRELPSSEKILDRVRIMILDCGGGTTDLASCEVTAEETGVGQKLSIKTEFANGDSNFGGNNITFRILQLLKIKLAAQADPETMGPCDLKELIPYDESTILNMIESARPEQAQMKPEDEIYRAFEAAYQRAEMVIPTVYQDNEQFCFIKQRKKIKRNYYYLWQLAERVKLWFYNKDQVQVDFGRDVEQRLMIDEAPGSFYLYQNSGGELKKVPDPGSHVEVTIKEIQLLLYGEIYGLLYQLLTQNGFDVDRYTYYRLSGQSCRIALFMELMKEFIPGRRLRMVPSVKKQSGPMQGQTGSLGLKLSCIQGSAAYIRDKECGKIKPEISVSNPKLIYDVTERRGDQEGMALIARDGVGAKKISIARYAEGSNKAELLIKDAQGRIERLIVIPLPSAGDARDVELDQVFDDVRQLGCMTAGADGDGSDQNAVAPDAISELHDMVINERPQDGSEILVFAIPSKEGYGMNLYRLIKQVEGGQQVYKWYDPIYENYENESNKTFFDGKR